MAARWRIAAAGVAGSGLIVFGESWGFDEYGSVRSATDMLVAFAFLAAGLVAWARRPENRTGPLMAIVGALWTVPNWRFSDHVAVVNTLGNLSFGGVAFAVLVALLGFPEGRVPRGRADRLCLYAAAGVTLALWPATVTLMEPRRVDCSGCDAGLNLIQLVDDAAVQDAATGVWGMLFALVLLWGAGRLAIRFRRASAPRRRAYGPLFVGAGIAAIAVALSYLPVGGPPSTGHNAQDLGLGIFLAGLACIPGGMLLGVLRTRSGRSPLAEMLVRLHEVRTGGDVRDLLARALGDPGLRLGLWAPSLERYVDEAGRPVDVAGTTTQVMGRDGTLAVIMHDPALLEDRSLLDAVVAAARFALENERLQAEVRAQLAEVRASRARIVAAGDEQRRRIERNLHDGAQQRLVSMALGLQLVRDQLGDNADVSLSILLDEVAEEARGAVSELRQLAQGIHPAILVDEGLGAALRGLAERVPVPVTLDAELGGRMPPPVEVAAYFSCAEAITNAVKHAGATAISVAARQEQDRLVLDVADDGAGGASLDRGTGLRGLEDRIVALGGRLDVASPPGAGTRVRVEIPLQDQG